MDYDKSNTLRRKGSEMKKKFYKTMRSIIKLLEQYDLEPKLYIEGDERYYIRINEYMKDPGFCYDNVILHLFVDFHERVMFIGLLRIPKKLRKTGLGSIILEKIMDFVNENHFFIYLDACNESQCFWQKNGFQHMFHDPNMFVIMGYSADQWDIFWEWEDFKKTKIYQTFLSDHDEEFVERLE